MQVAVGVERRQIAAVDSATRAARAGAVGRQGKLRVGGTQCRTQQQRVGAGVVERERAQTDHKVKGRAAGGLHGPGTSDRRDPIHGQRVVATADQAIATPAVLVAVAGRAVAVVGLAAAKALGAPLGAKVGKAGVAAKLIAHLRGQVVPRQRPCAATHRQRPVVLHVLDAAQVHKQRAGRRRRRGAGAGGNCRRRRRRRHGHSRRGGGRRQGLAAVAADPVHAVGQVPAALLRASARLGARVGRRARHVMAAEAVLAILQPEKLVLAAQHAAQRGAHVAAAGERARHALLVRVAPGRLKVLDRLEHVQPVHANKQSRKKGRKEKEEEERRRRRKKKEERRKTKKEEKRRKKKKEEERRRRNRKMTFC